jgi:hypothetical protein
MPKITIVLNLRKPKKEELIKSFDVGTTIGSLIGVVLAIRELILQYNIGILFQPQYYFNNFLPIFAIVILLGYAIAGIYETKKKVKIVMV